MRERSSSAYAVLDTEEMESRPRSQSENRHSTNERSSRRVLGKFRRRFSGLSVSADIDRDVTLAMKLQREFARSSWDLTGVWCEVDPSTVNLFGVVRSRRALQVALEIARNVADGRRLQLDVDVMSPH